MHHHIGPELPEHLRIGQLVLHHHPADAFDGGKHLHPLLQREQRISLIGGDHLVCQHPYSELSQVRGPPDNMEMALVDEVGAEAHINALPLCSAIRLLAAPELLRNGCQVLLAVDLPAQPPSQRQGLQPDLVQHSIEGVLCVHPRSPPAAKICNCL